MDRHILQTLAVLLASALTASAEIPDWTRSFQPLPSVVTDAPGEPSSFKVALGRRLYFETRFSKNGKISCNTCHQIENYGVDGEKPSPGHAGERGSRNSPTVFNAALHSAQF